MLPRQHRLNSSADLRHVMRRGRRFVVPISVLSSIATDTNSPSRVGVIVSKKVGNSVVRHAVARKIRHAGWELVRSYPTGVDIVVRAQPSAASASVDEWAHLLLKTAEKLNSVTPSSQVQ